MIGAGTRLFPIALMALLAALTFWLEQATQGNGGERDGRNRHDPDYFVDRFELRRFDADGKLQHALVAEKMLHFMDDDSTRVTAPRLTYLGPATTRLSADTAWLDKDGKHVRLDGNVRLLRDGNAQRLPLELATSVLHVVPDDEVAHTDAPVTLAQGKTLINARGMEVNNKTRIAVLSGPVRGAIYSGQIPLSPTNSIRGSIQDESKVRASPPLRRPADKHRRASGKG